MRNFILSISSATRAGIWLGPLTATVIWAIPLDIPSAQHRLLGLIAWIFIWWICETVPLAANAVLGASLAVVMGIADAKIVYSAFGNPTIFLFMGGFLIARAMAVHGLDRRIALYVLSRHWIAGRTWRCIVALVAMGAFLAMWLSNTAAMAMMLPIGMGVLANLFPEDKDSQGICLMAIAYGVSLGGMATPIGTPPNIIAIGAIESLLGINMSFVGWMVAGMPVTLLTIGLMLYVIRKHLPRQLPLTEASQFLREHRNLGPVSSAEKNVLIALGAAVSLWMVPALLDIFLPQTHPVALWAESRMPEPVGSVLGASLLFLLPTGNNRRTLTWSEAAGIDFGTLILFGGGLAIGGMIFDSGLAKTLGDALFRITGPGTPFLLFIGALVYFTIFFSEFTSATAGANMVVPLAVGLAQAANFNPSRTAAALALACSMGFMTPIATPPNAIAYSSGLIPIQRMLKIGLILNLLGGLIIILAFFWLRKIGFQFH